MLSVLSTVTPIFALIFTGWSVRRMGIFSSQAVSELNRFVVYLALPALLFDIIAKAQWTEIWRPAFMGTFGLGTLALFGVTVAIRLRRPLHLADAAIDGLNSAYANTGFMGFPLAVAAFGHQALTPTLIATIITACIVFGLAMILIEVGLQSEQHPRHMVRKITGSIIRNPLIAAPAAGAAVMAMGTGLPVPAEKFLALLGSSASPCALVTLGLFMAEKRESAANGHEAVALLTIMKLIVHPAMTWAIGAWIFRLPKDPLHVAVLMAALPTGTGPFMVAEFYRREAATTSKVILTSTIISLATITLYLGVI
ncbi:AEC family transporter [Novosphingobium malaysiense]|uniref:Transporter n=1 Tax=Novosphingobium malaysiense TaxID=1348853 RepID=A0A0B1ZM52_9SPHN|nr:AEC family transporter [Novosphingobium malaysiense]KHK90414.1 transporter [Novosphingobium malaysiense]